MQQLIAFRSKLKGLVMYASNIKNKRQQPYGWSVYNCLLNKGTAPFLGRQGVYRRWVAILLLAGLSGPLGATSSDAHMGSAASVDTLEIPTTVPLTLYEPMSIGQVQTATDAQLQVEASESGTRTASAGATTVSYEFPTNIRLTWETISASQQAARTSEGAATKVSTEKLYAAVDPEVGTSTSTRQVQTLAENFSQQQGGETSSRDATGFSYAITLAVFALLGLVSVARRDVNKLKS